MTKGITLTQAQARPNLSMEAGGGQQTLAEKLLKTDSYWEMENQFSFRACPLEGQPCASR